MAKKPAAAEGLTQLKNDLKLGSPASLYIFHGEEQFLRSHYLELLKKKVLDGPAEEFNYHRFTQENMDLEELARAVEALPMMAERTLIQVDDYDFNRQPESSREAFCAILEDIPPYCTLVLVYTTVEYKVDGRMTRLKNALGRGVEVEFGRQSQRELNNWIHRHFQTHGKSISDQLCEYLTFITGGTMTALGGEIEKIAAFSSGSEITRQDIDTVVEPVLDAQVFQMTNAITEGNYASALSILRTLLQMQEEPIPLLAAIGGQFRRLLWAKTAMSAGQGEGCLSDMLRSATGRAPQEYAVRKTMSAARKISDRFCEQAVTLCLEADARLKSYSGDPERVLELLLLELAQEASHD